jgi:hypothetical protein
VVGVDVSDDMLRKAHDNCRGFDNVSLLEGDDQLSAVTDPLDLVNTYRIVAEPPTGYLRRKMPASQICYSSFIHRFV